MPGAMTPGRCRRGSAMSWFFSGAADYVGNVSVRRSAHSVIQGLDSVRNEAR